MYHVIIGSCAFETGKSGIPKPLFYQMSSYESPLHIVSTEISELEMAFAQKSMDGKSNEIPAVQEL